MGEVPVCRDCKHRTWRYDCRLGVILRPERSVVDGTISRAFYRSCSRQRGDYAECGPRGKLFERKWTVRSALRALFAGGPAS